MIAFLIFLGVCVAIVAAAAHGSFMNGAACRADARRFDDDRQQARLGLEHWIADGMRGLPPPPPAPPNVLRASGLPIDLGACHRWCVRENARRHAAWQADMQHWSDRLREAREREGVRVLNHNGPAPVNREPLPPPAPPRALPGGGL